MGTRRDVRTAQLLAEAGATVRFSYDAGSDFKWRARINHEDLGYGYDTESAVTLWGLHFAVRKVARRLAKAGQMQRRADLITKAVSS